MAGPFKDFTCQSHVRSLSPGRQRREPQPKVPRPGFSLETRGAAPGLEAGAGSRGSALLRVARFPGPSALWRQLLRVSSGSRPSEKAVNPPGGGLGHPGRGNRSGGHAPAPQSALQAVPGPRPCPAAASLTAGPAPRRGAQRGRPHCQHPPEEAQSQPQGAWSGRSGRHHHCGQSGASMPPRRGSREENGGRRQGPLYLPARCSASGRR